MRIHITIAMLILISMSGKTQIEETDLRNKPGEVREWNSFYFKTNPLAIIQGPIPGVAEYRAGFEAMAAPRLSYQPSVSYIGKSPLFNILLPDTGFGLSGRDFMISGYRLQGQLRYYYLNFHGNDLSSLMRPSGLYVGLHSSFSTATIRLRNQALPKISINHFNVNTLFGLQFMISDVIGLDIYSGLGYKQNTMFETDLNNVTTQLSLHDLGLGRYYRSNLKVTVGFDLAIGLW